MFHCLPNVIETKKDAKFFSSPNTGNSFLCFFGGGDQDWVRSHFHPFFKTIPLDNDENNYNDYLFIQVVIGTKFYKPEIDFLPIYQNLPHYSFSLHWFSQTQCSRGCTINIFIINSLIKSLILCENIFDKSSLGNRS